MNEQDTAGSVSNMAQENRSGAGGAAPSGGLESELDFLRGVVARLKQDFDAECTESIRVTIRQQAQIQALSSLLEEVLQRFNVSPEVFRQHQDLRSRFFMDQHLLGAEDFHQGFGAELEDRSEDEIYTGDGYPPLFLDDPQNG